MIVKNKIHLILNSKFRNKNINKRLIKINNFLYDKYFIKKYLINNTNKFLKIKCIKYYNKK